MTVKKMRRAADAQTVRTVSSGESTVNIGNSSRTAETVAVLFRSRSSQTFLLPRGRKVTINGNAVYLANAHGGALPAGGYGVTVVDKADWDEVMKLYGKTYAPWFRSGRLQVRERETKAVNFALDHAGDKTGDDPMPNKGA